LAEIRPDLPAAVLAVVERMLAKEPADRYQTPAAVIEALSAATRGRPVPKGSDLAHQRRRTITGIPTLLLGMGAAVTFCTAGWGPAGKPTGPAAPSTSSSTAGPQPALAAGNEPVRPTSMAGLFREVQFVPESSQVTVFHKIPVEAILYSLDGSTWHRAESLQTQATALGGMQCAQARLNNAMLFARQDAGKLFVKCQTATGQDEQVHELYFDPRRVGKDRRDVPQPQANIGKIQREAEELLKQANDMIKALEKEAEQRQ